LVSSRCPLRVVAGALPLALALAFFAALVWASALIKPFNASFSPSNVSPITLSASSLLPWAQSKALTKLESRLGNGCLTAPEFCSRRARTRAVPLVRGRKGS
ncbi:hypothetical protein AMTR_s00015p00162720, partial [Amborella trichopoda]